MDSMRKSVFYTVMKNLQLLATNNKINSTIRHNNQPAAVMACVCTKAVRGMSSSTKLMITAHKEIEVSASVVVKVDLTIPISATVHR
jgi:hypothetical protein